MTMWNNWKTQLPLKDRKVLPCKYTIEEYIENCRKHSHLTSLGFFNDKYIGWYYDTSIQIYTFGSMHDQRIYFKDNDHPNKILSKYWTENTKCFTDKLGFLNYLRDEKRIGSIL